MYVIYHWTWTLNVGQLTGIYTTLGAADRGEPAEGVVTATTTDFLAHLHDRQQLDVYDIVAHITRRPLLAAVHTALSAPAISRYTTLYFSKTNKIFNYIRWGWKTV